MALTKSNSSWLPSNYVVMFNQDELGGLLTGSLSVINNLFGK